MSGVPCFCVRGSEDSGNEPHRAARETRAVALIALVVFVAAGAAAFQTNWPIWASAVVLGGCAIAGGVAIAVAYRVLWLDDAELTATFWKWHGFRYCERFRPRLRPPTRFLGWGQKTRF